MKLFHLCCVLLCLLVGKLNAQAPLKDDGSASKIGTSLQSYMQAKPQEKIHVHFNKPSYLVGDTVWFKVYLLNTNGNVLSGLSKVVYLEITGAKGLVKRVTLPVDAGMASGQFKLNDSLYTAGSYNIRAYTQLMRNNGEDFYFKHNLQVTGGSVTFVKSKPLSTREANPAAAQTKVEIAKPQELSLTFFPEGGSLVNGIRSKLGLKAIGSDGYGVSLKGHIENDRKEVVALFETVHAGMGMLALMPQENAAYTAVISEGEFKDQRFALPPSQKEGYVLSVNRTEEEKLNLRISRSKGMENSSEIKLVVQANGEVQRELTLPMIENSISFTLPLKEMEEGINQVTLFSANNQPLAERLVFVRRDITVQTQIQADQPAYQTRDKVTLSLSNTIAQVGGYSASVTKQEDSDPVEEQQQTILSNLLLTSELKGYIEDPNYYFTNENQQKQSQLDLLMLTQGWRRFNWTDVLSDKVEHPKFKAQEGLQISGTVTTMGGKPIAGAKVNLLASRDMVILDTVADAEGRFVFRNLDLSDSSTVMIRARGAKESSNVKITLDEREQLPVPVFEQPMAIRTDTASSTIKTVQPIEPVNKKIVQGTTLKTVEIIKKRKIPEIKGSVYPFAAAPPDYTLEPDKLQDMVTLHTSLRGMFAGVQVRGDRVFGLNGGVWGPMAILLNGYYIDDLSGINPRSLIGVQIVKGGIGARNMSTALMTDSTSFGIVFLTMGLVDAKYIKANRPTGFLQQEFNGYTFAREFYAPRYDVQKLEPKSDYRSALFWKADIITNEEGKAAFDFYTSDEKGRYRVTLEGIGADGQLSRKVTYFEVK